MFGLLPSGFKRKQYTDIKESMETRAKNLFGEDVNLAEKSPLGLFIRLFAWSVGILWQLAEKVYFSAYVHTAEGSSLDHVSKYIGISRFPATSATGEVTFTGDEGIGVPEGFLVQTPDGIVFEVLEGGTIDNTEQINLEVQAIDVGTIGNVSENRITEIVNPLAGLNSVNNSDPISGGSNVESDDALRERYELSVSQVGSSTSASIEATILQVDGVVDAKVRENDLPTTENGIPPKSIAPLVLGGANEDIARAILKTKAAGILSFGSVVETVEDSRGVEFDIGFTRPTEAPITVDVTLTTNATFPGDGNEQIRTAIIQYIGGEDEDGSTFTGLRLGQDVIYTQIIGLCHTVQGVTDVSLTVNTGTSNIPIDDDEIATTIFTDVVVS